MHPAEELLGLSHGCFHFSRHFPVPFPNGNAVVVIIGSQEDANHIRLQTRSSIPVYLHLHSHMAHFQAADGRHIGREAQPFGKVVVIVLAGVGISGVGDGVADEKDLLPGPGVLQSHGVSIGRWFDNSRLPTLILSEERPGEGEAG